ncbi:MAG: TniQ family protein [Marinospirillum sp.]|uniref:TniQ family protein n=1 Tax=Marinospirillum sp. TaxID=2183934 RepID=UPI0019F248E8|nr:TniQ family protein [Marinospirillum sp.]MBE0506979.1 TniQ family protein [Marinospirillum sp.]
MLSGTLWPAHPHPLQDECLSSWLVRCAHANGMKVQTFCDQVFGKEYQVWYRDIDRNAPDWLLNIMSQKTGTPIKLVHHTTARLYEKRLFPILHPASQLRWFLPAKHHHRINTGYGIQYCPACLAADETPYFRLAWRLSLYTFCPKHRILMADRCHKCGAPVAFHRAELGKPNILAGQLDHCWQCDAKLSNAATTEINLYPKRVNKLWSALLKVIDQQFYPSGHIRYQNLTLLHQLCRLMSSHQSGKKLIQHVCGKGGYLQPNLSDQRTHFELRDIQERHAILQLAWWLMTHKRKLRTAIQQKTIRINLLYRDLEPETKAHVLKWIESRSRTHYRITINY